MQIDLRNAEPFPGDLRAEVCIVGAGIAGLVLAHKLAQQGTDVVLLEAGPLTADPEPPSPQPEPCIELVPGSRRGDGRVAMRAYLHPGSSVPSCSAFGGTSLTWGGQLLPMLATEASAALSAAPAPWVISAADLAPYLAAAEKLLAVDDLPYEGPGFFAAVGAKAPKVFAEVPGTVLRVSKFAPFSRRNLAQTLGRDLLAHPRARVVVRARATQLVMRPTGADGRMEIKAVLLERADGPPLRVLAKHFVIAAGTLETVRLLLASFPSEEKGWGYIGRNVHDHLTLTAAVFTGAARDQILAQVRPWILRGPKGPTVHGIKLETSAALCAELGSLPAMAHLTLTEPQHSSLGSLRALLRQKQEHTSGSVPVPRVRQILAAMAGGARLVWAAWRHKRRYVSAQAEVALRLNCAQLTASRSLVTLGDAVDEYGQRKPILDWRVEPEECQTLFRFAAHLRRALGALSSDPGVRWTPALFPPFAQEGSEISETLVRELTDARHLMGGAVMGTDERSSVVDAQLCVHDVANLHIASLAVFPDGSAQLPTLTLMALTLRLADHLRQRLGSR